MKSTPKDKAAEPAAPSKSEKPLTQKEASRIAQEDDEDEDLQAALQDNPQGSSDLEQQESDLLSQLDSFMVESVKLDTLPNPTVGQKSRARSIQKVMTDLEMKLEEIAAQKTPSKA